VRDEVETGVVRLAGERRKVSTAPPAQVTFGAFWQSAPLLVVSGQPTTSPARESIDLSSLK
jgi:hypothetical protein